MVTTVICALAGAAGSAALWIGLRTTFEAPVFGRTNYRGHTVPVGAGVVIVLASVLVGAVDGAWHVFRRGSGLGAVGVGPALAVVTGFGLLGLFDDLGASGSDRGFRGHLTAMRRGRLTTGGVKLVFGGLLAVAVAAALDGPSVGRVVVDALLIALAANVGNLLDRAPGRTGKVTLLCGVPLLLVEHGPAMAGVAVVVGAAAGLLVFDLREELMLGDAGANALGAALGLGVVISCPFAVRVVTLVVVVLLNAASERVSFSTVIDRVPPLRFADRLGRRAPDQP
jgi:hypothetical protein